MPGQADVKEIRGTSSGGGFLCPAKKIGLFFFWVFKGTAADGVFLKHPVLLMFALWRMTYR